MLDLPANRIDKLAAMSDQKPCPIRGTWLRDFIMAGTSKFDLLKQKKPRRGQPCGSGILNVWAHQQMLSYWALIRPSKWSEYHHEYHRNAEEDDEDLDSADFLGGGFSFAPLQRFLVFVFFLFLCHFLPLYMTRVAIILLCSDQLSKSRINLWLSNCIRVQTVWK